MRVYLTDFCSYSDVAFEHSIQSLPLLSTTPIFLYPFRRSLRLLPYSIFSLLFGIAFSPFCSSQISSSIPNHRLCLCLCICSWQCPRIIIYAAFFREVSQFRPLFFFAYKTASIGASPTSFVFCQFEFPLICPPSLSTLAYLALTHSLFPLSARFFQLKIFTCSNFVFFQEQVS